MKNICFLCFCVSEHGGVNRAVTSLCNELVKSENYKVHILSICESDNKPYYKLDDNILVDYIGADTKWRLRKVALFSFFRLVRYLKRNKIDILFMVGHYTPVVALFTKLFVRCKFVFCDHGAIQNQISDRKATTFRKVASKISDKTVVLTRRSKEFYEKKFKYNAGKIEYIYNFLDENTVSFAGKYNVESKKILSVGLVRPEKGYDMLVFIAEKVLKMHPDWQWHVYGGGKDLDKFRDKSKSLGLENRLIFKGSVDNIYEVYKEYSIYVMTSYREGLPIVLLEAKANGLPVVSFDCKTGPAEIVRNNIDGYLIECYDKDKMANKISDLIENKNLRIEISNRSKENLIDFDKETIVNKWKNLICEI